MTHASQDNTIAHADPASAALHDAAWYRLGEDAGVLVVSDADHVDFLQRMTTNNLATLRPGDAAVTILTSPTARIVHVFPVLALDGALWLLPAAGETGALARHLRGQIFFMDKVKVQDASEAWQRLRVVGPRAAEVVADLGITLPNGDDRWAESNGVLAYRQRAGVIPGIELLLPAQAAAATIARLAEAGAFEVANPAHIDALRIALGLPAPGAELTSDYTPLEVAMDWACSESKGCYTGQEIIARQRTYDKVTRTLTGLRSTQLLAVGAPLLLDGREAGKVTSVARHPESGAPIALAVVKRPANIPGTRLLCGDEEVEVVALPFSA